MCLFMCHRPRLCEHVPRPASGHPPRQDVAFPSREGGRIPTVRLRHVPRQERTKRGFASDVNLRGKLRTRTCDLSAVQHLVRLRCALVKSVAKLKLFLWSSAVFITDNRFLDTSLTTKKTTPPLSRSHFSAGRLFPSYFRPPTPLIPVFTWRNDVMQGTMSSCSVNANTATKYIFWNPGKVSSERPARYFPSILAN